jgi:hypothetical protein
MLLVKTTKTKTPALIIRDRAVAAINIGELAISKRSGEPSSLDSFDLTAIRISKGPASEPVSELETRSALRKRLMLSPSIRVASLLFLALSYDYSKKSRIVIVSHQIESFMEALSNDLRLFYPHASVITLHGNMADHIYADKNPDREIELPPKPSPDDENTYLLSLGVTLTHHRDLVRHFRPTHGLMGIETKNEQNFQFYQGEMWISPFGGSQTRITYVRTTFLPEDYIIDPTLAGPVWEGRVIMNSLLRFRHVTNENVAYLHPELGVDLYLFEEFPNDYSHLFAYHAVYEYFRKLNPSSRPSLDDFETAFKLAVKR